ncbi:SCO family protein [Wenxinia saemankumensis]|uniref:Protein SCO1/2 n=1 Tax=Wenxinia saemankumensis TaxID=1447782 RepID=A0A1M6G4D3_9RHOB|nr:SCO family protein [Wenxinia saemankumensis]SHJ04828.1 protein SCO1/2 [Wenxinia saemankumensis]
MTDASRKRIVLASSAVLIAAIFAAFWFGVVRPRYDTDVLGQLGQGEYVLATTDGTPFTAESLDGAPTAVFFGFTHCPEVCPTTLGDIATWNGIREDEGQAPIRTFFITADPERDTPELLADYVGWVDDVTGVTGTPEEMAKAVRAFRVYVAKVPLEDGDYTVDHSAMVLLFDEDGRFVEPISYGEETEVALSKIARAVEG